MNILLLYIHCMNNIRDGMCHIIILSFNGVTCARNVLVRERLELIFGQRCCE